ncbi:hypothetical protein [uncultured Bacteroides sp.]|nr:hypothetical protein [uncultured Bacteroides sp.]
MKKIRLDFVETDLEITEKAGLPDGKSRSAITKIIKIPEESKLC